VRKDFSSYGLSQGPDHFEFELLFSPPNEHSMPSPKATVIIPEIAFTSHKSMNLSKRRSGYARNLDVSDRLPNRLALPSNAHAHLSLDLNNVSLMSEAVPSLMAVCAGEGSRWDESEQYLAKLLYFLFPIIQQDIAHIMTRPWRPTPTSP